MQFPLQTPIGPMLATWTDNGLYSCEFAPANNCEPASCRPQTVAQLQHRLDRYFEQGYLEYDLDELDWTGLTDFNRRVLSRCFEVSAGETMTYGALAAACGRAKAARAVGGVMARNRWPILIPCHRVVGASGKLTGYSGTGGLETKRWLLDFEKDSAVAAMA